MPATQRAVVRLLADGGLHSGEALAAALGVSRAAVWKAVQRAAAGLGIEVEAVRGQGYRLARPLVLLDTDAIAASLDAEARRRIAAIEVLDDIDSTNSHLLRAAANGAASGLVCLAERQRAGRGRLGRPWVSPYGGNLYLSMLWRYPLPPAALGGLSLAAGVAVARGLAAAGAEGVGLKWPNDLHWRRRKLGGLLIEVAGEVQGPSQVVVGVGVNLALTAGQGAGIDQPWVDLAEVLGVTTPPRNLVAARLVDALSAALVQFGCDGLGAFLDDWRALDAYRGEPAEIIDGDRRIGGVLAGIDAGGALLLDSAGGRRTFAAGEVSLRPLGAG